MLVEIALVMSMLVCGTHAYQGEDMSEEDFAAYLGVHDKFRETYQDSAIKGCVAGAIKDGLKGGFQGLCIGCATGAATGVGMQMIFPTLPERPNK